MKILVAYDGFEHSDNAHVMVLCDEPGAHKVSSIGTFQHNPSAGTVFGPAGRLVKTR